MTISREDQKINLALSFIINSGGIKTSKPEPGIVSENIQRSLESSKATANKFTIIWGPAVFRVDDVGRKKSVIDKKDDHVLFIVQNRYDPNDYHVVIRGSWSDINWLNEDIIVCETQDWARWDSRSPENAKIAYGTDMALGYIINQMKSNNSPGYGESLTDAIDKIALKEGIQNITITGHSLGGVLSSTIGLYLKRRYLDKGNNNIRINVCAFAGPTAGNDVFASYSESIFNDISVAGYKSNFLRIHNSMDVVPLAWHIKDLEEVKAIYPVLTVTINALILSVFNKNYTQISPDFPIHSQIPISPIVSFDDLLVNIGNQHTHAYAKEYDMSFITIDDNSNIPTDYDIVVVNDSLSESIVDLFKFLTKDKINIT
ncbi:MULTISPECIES: lipase family protein [Photorhabdus]|uniref:lipase family protein n=1 Tax=Photorhabdus TaxID=29487 RepID=UPI000DCBECB6|nr:MULTISPECIES: lipase family protein [Photorhabdus]MCT8344687.1 lipase family protein [Photorhabdus kleinii]RAX03096.1 lipase [Photorhabdus sp. S9-53]RAX03433.1 lipase [Photorhabdus sp. S10-54]RAX05839.1 lipase [Photorhabdus sp. S8-52]